MELSEISRRSLLGTSVASVLAAALPGWAKAAPVLSLSGDTAVTFLPGHRLATLGQGWVLVTGGLRPGSQRGDSRPNGNTVAYLINPATGETYAAAPMQVGRAFHALVPGPDGLVYAIGGHASSPVASIEAYEMSANRWTFAGELRTLRGEVNATFVGNQLVVTGRNGGFELVRPRLLAATLTP
ncbi:MAG: kelch repeat-containing protein [Fimbriimonadaceae bacterium]|nr:kelch repeat-containing protein [Fimbriimonadaceae bacterium]